MKIYFVISFHTNWEETEKNIGDRSSITVFDFPFF